MSIFRQVPDLKFALGLSTMMSFYGIVSLIVYMLPTEKYGYSMTYKIVVIALILLTLPIALVAGIMVSRRSKKAKAAEEAAKEAAKEGEAPDKADAEKQKLNKPQGDYSDIGQAAEETVQFLKSSNLGGGKDAVYELPWYLVVGNPKSGKTSLSIASGLNFQKLPSQRESELKFVRPTKNIDWRVTSDAVFLDTAGRYQLEGSDQDEWSGLLETLKKYRGNRPLDGMILSVSAERLLHADEQEIEQIAKVLRSRIDEAIERLKVRFPVYLVFTHADSIEGFRDSFSNSQKEGQNLVWGATIPLEKSENAHTLFDSEFDLLQNSVMKRRLMRLSAPFPPVRQLKIFNFPLHFGSARKKLGHFVNNLFRPNPFSESPFLRGFYFTAVPVNRPKMDGGQTMTNVGQTVGESYFAQKLFRDVILRDKDLVATFQSQKVKPPIMGWVLTILGTLLTFALLLASGISLFQNKQMVESASKNGETVLTMVRGDKERNPLTKNAEETNDEILKIEELRRSLLELDKYDRDGSPILMRFGFYSGNKLYLDKLLPIYYNAIEQRYKKPLVKKIEDDLRKFSSGNVVASAGSPTPQEQEVLGKNYDLLRTYLMLSKEDVDPNRKELKTYRDYAEPTTLTTTLSEFLKTEAKIPEGMEAIAQQQLEFYFKQVKRDSFPSIKLEKTLVDATRTKLEAFPAWARYYKDVTTEISKKVDPISAETILAGVNNDGGLSGSYTVPGAYTVDAYRKFVKEAILKSPEAVNKDNWVMGGKADKGQADGTVVKLVEDKYLNDYADNWRKFVRSIEIAKYESKEGAVESLRAFADTGSPMKKLLQEVAKQTNISAEPVGTGWIDSIMSYFTGKKSADNKADTLVDKDFRPLFAFVDAKEDSPISKYGNAYQKILKCSDPECDIEKLTLPEITTQVQSQKGAFVKLLSGAEKELDGAIGSFKGTSAGQDIATLLKKPLNNFNNYVGGGIVNQLEKIWREQILSKAKEAEKGFPFDAEGEADLTKLTAYLNPTNGTFTKFYNDNLQKYFEDVNGQLKEKASNGDIKFTEDFVKYLNAAFRLREALFGKNATPGFGYDFKLSKVNDALIEVTIDGQKIDSNGTGSTTFKFPAASGETGAFMNFASTAENTPTSGKPPVNANTSANSSSPPVNTISNTAPKAFQDSTSSPSPSGASKIAFAGTWGLFKFFEQGSPKKQPSGEYVLTYKLGGKTVTATVKPTGGDLFDRSIFTSARAPQNLLKGN